MQSGAGIVIMTIIIMTFPHLHFDWRVKRLVMPSAQSSRRRHRPFICERSKNARGMVGGGSVAEQNVDWKNGFERTKTLGNTFLRHFFRSVNLKIGHSVL